MFKETLCRMVQTLEVPRCHVFVEALGVMNGINIVVLLYILTSTYTSKYSSNLLILHHLNQSMYVCGLILNTSSKNDDKQMMTRYRVCLRIVFSSP